MLELPDPGTTPSNRMRSPLHALLALSGLALAFGAGSCGGGAAEPGDGRDPNRPPQHVLLIVIDTLRADHLSCYGYPRVTSPNIDALATRGVRFDQHIAQSSWTAPSMVTMMTGQRLTGPRLDVPDEVPVLAELFKDAGYRTGAWSANELLCAENKFDRGFDVFVDEKEWHSTQPVGRLDEIVAWLKENKDKDTFTWVHFTDPHDPYVPPAKTRTEEPVELSPELRQLIANVATDKAIEGVEPETAYIAHEIGRYDDEIVSVDLKVRQLLMTLQEIGRLDDAVVVVTSDHGETLWQRAESDMRVLLRHKKREEQAEQELGVRVRDLFKQTHGDFVYQELVRVPLIIAAPGLEAGSVVSAPLESIHLPRTILALAGVEVEGVERMVGRDLFGGNAPTGAYSMTKLGEAFVSEDNWKLILPTARGVEDWAYETQLYDLGEDPHERNNLAGERPEKVVELTKRIEDRRAVALPRLTELEQNQRMLENEARLRALGYTDLIDDAQPGDAEGSDGAEEESSKGSPEE